MTTNSDKLIDELLADVKDPKEIFGPSGLFMDLRKKLMERVLDAEMESHLGYAKHSSEGNNSGNSRNGYRKKTILTDDGKVEIAVPRDRECTFEPLAVQKHKRHDSGFDDRVIGLYARGMSTRDIKDYLEEFYGAEVSIDLISRVTSAVTEHVKEWQCRPLAEVWPIIYIDALVLKIRDNGQVRKKSMYVVLGVNTEGLKEVLGLWLADTEGARFWMQVLTELKARGVEDILILCCDGLKGLPQTIDAVFPKTVVQTCIVHMVRYSLSQVSWKNRRAVVAKLKPIYQAATLDAAATALDEFEEEWGKKYPSIVRSWRSNWDHLTAFFAFTTEIRRVIYTTNAIEAVNRQIRKSIKTRGAFPNDTAAMKLVWLALERASKKWRMPIREWDQAMQQLDIHFDGRLGL